MVLALGISCGTLGCSDIRRDTFEVELTTDELSKIVELWNQPVPLSNDYARAFAIELPQNYYVYRDNHHYLRQTRIGLLLDKETLQPLAKRLSAEAGVIEPLDLSPGKEGALKREWGRYRQRDLLVTIKGSMPGYPDLRQRLDASSTTLADFVGVRDGFKVFAPHGPASTPQMPDCRRFEATALLTRWSIFIAGREWPIVASPGATVERNFACDCLARKCPTRLCSCKRLFGY